jgi:two-component system sensor histidine kinase SenX3
VEAAQRKLFYQLMLDDTDRLLGTVEQVLKAGEVGYKQPPPSLAEVDFGVLVDQCMDLARTRHHLKPEALRWSESLNGSAITVRGDAGELRTAVSNILDNAIKYSTAGNVEISVWIETGKDNRIALRVRDRGIGIPENELKQIFKRFYRVQERPASQVKGTGLGLFIVRSIARAHGGKVFAESAGNSRGTTVTLELPRSEG